MKSASRSKLLHCFRPMVDMDVAIEPESSVDDGLGFAYDLNAESGDEMRLVSEKKRTFSRVVKAVFFETVLTKRVRDAKCDKQKSKGIIRRSSSRSSITSSTALSTSDSAKSNKADREDRVVAANNKSREEDSDHHHHRRRGNNIGLCLLISISLAITVLCGRFLAIVFTSVWLYALLLSGDRRRESLRYSPPLPRKVHD